VLDLGCGSGVLAIAAARAMPRAQVMASDNDPIAVEVARANADANGARRVVTACAMGLEHPWLRHAAPFDLIIANILAGPLRALSGDVAGSIRRGGYVVLSGILNPEAPAVIAAYVAHGFEVLKRRQIGDWTTLTLRRRA
jgi:ribosomal protein L11 methyltransferase